MADVSVAEYEKALLSLQEAIDFVNTRKVESEYKIARDAAIQRFEFCVELSWKVSAKLLGSNSSAPKPVIREMAQNQIISEVNRWFDYVEARNKSSHTYDENIAIEVYGVLVKFMDDGFKLLEVLKSK